MPWSSCGYSRFPSAKHFTRPLTDLVPFHNPFGCVFLLLLQFHHLESFITLREQFKTVQTNPIVSSRENAFALLLSRKLHFTASRVLFLSLLPGNECHCWMSLSCTLFTHPIDLLFGNRSSPTRSLLAVLVKLNSIIST